MQARLRYSKKGLENIETIKAVPQGFKLGNDEKLYGVGNYSSVFVKDLMEISGLDQDKKVLSTFAEVNQRHVGRFPTVMPRAFLSNALDTVGGVMPTIYDVPTVKKEDVMEQVTTEKGAYLRVKGDDKPFYYVFAVEDPGLVPGLVAIGKRWGYSYCYSEYLQVISLSNTVSALQGYPPNCTALRMPKITTTARRVTEVYPTCVGVMKEVHMRDRPKKRWVIQLDDALVLSTLFSVGRSVQWTVADRIIEQLQSLFGDGCIHHDELARARDYVSREPIQRQHRCLAKLVKREI